MGSILVSPWASQGDSHPRSWQGCYTRFPGTSVGISIGLRALICLELGMPALGSDRLGSPWVRRSPRSGLQSARELRLARACLNLLNLLLPPPSPLRERLLSLSGFRETAVPTRSRPFFALFLLSFCFLHFCSLFYPILPPKSRPGPPKIVSKWSQNWSRDPPKIDPKNRFIFE